jgi:hypothetical protein
MDHVRYSYLHKIRQMALQQGFIVVQAPSGDPDADLEGYLTSEWSSHDDESSLYTLVVQATGESLFADGVTLGQIEDYLMTAAG